VLQALRDWNDQLGDPPRSYEWAPASARSRGLSNARTVLWEQRYPRWPSATTVARYFGRWSLALEAAGLPLRAIAPGTGRAQRIEMAQQMARLGSRTATIAAALDVSPRTVRSYLCAGRCRDCGDPVVTDAARCPRCAARKAIKPWATHAEVLAAIRTWTQETGAPPRHQDWVPTDDHERKWAREHPRWPSSMTVRTHFGSWGAALQAAGFPPYRERWTPEGIEAALRRFAREEDRPPTSDDLSYGHHRLPARQTVDQHFGSFAAALESAGFEPQRRRWTRSGILASMEMFRAQRGRLPTSRDWVRSTAHHPHATTVLQQFGSWSAATTLVRHPAPETRRQGE
jgi:hypothetical protein